MPDHLPTLDAERQSSPRITPVAGLPRIAALVGLIAVIAATAELGAPRPAAALVISPHFLSTLGVGESLEVRVAGARVLKFAPTTGSPNVIVGHADNAVTTERVGATIAGGGGAGADAHAVWGDYGSIGGGRRNEVGGEGPADNFAGASVRGGDLNSARASGATIGGGAFNIAAGTISTVSGGSSNEALGVGSSIGGGFANVASGNYATIPGGKDALADKHGQLAFSAGAFGPPQSGDAQTSLYLLRRLTTGATPVELFLDGSGARLTVAPDRALAFHVVVAARSSGGHSAGYTATGVVANQGGTTALVATPTKTLLGEDVPSWDFTIQADDVEDALVLLVAGAAATTIRWVATVETTEVAR